MLKVIFLGYNCEKGRYEKTQPDSSTTFEILTISCFLPSVPTLCDQRFETRDLGHVFQNGGTLLPC